jgi:hypothetical protein
MSSVGIKDENTFYYFAKRWCPRTLEIICKDNILDKSLMKGLADSTLSNKDWLVKKFRFLLSKNCPYDNEDLFKILLELKLDFKIEINFGKKIKN